MGSGKTTQGKKLASLLKFNFIDLDQYITEKENKSIEYIFESEGESAFREKETSYLKDIFRIPEPSVISLGGGTICFNDNLNLIKENGLLIYIELPVNVLTDRLTRAKRKRPLLKGVSRETIPQKIKELLDLRLVYYKQAHLTVNGLNLTPKLLHEKIIEFTKK